MSSTLTTPGRPTGLEPRSYTLELLHLAMPMIGMMVSRLLMTFIDFAMVSQLGMQAQAAISPASIFVFAIGCIGMGVAHAVQTFVSQADGRGEGRIAGAYAWQSFYIAAAFGLAVVPVILTTPTWFGWIARVGQHAPAVAAMEIEYVSVSLWAIPFTVVCVGLNGFFNGVQKPRITLVAVLVSLVVNFVGNWVLIFGNLGFPALGIGGAAIATVIAWGVRAAVLTISMLGEKYDRDYFTRSAYRFDADKMRGLLRIGAPTSFSWLVDIGSWSVFLVLIMPAFGSTALAASNIGLQYMHLSFMPAIGVGMALCSKVGFAIGERRPEMAVRYTNVALRLTGAYMGLVGIAFFTFREPLIWVFAQGESDPAVRAAVIEAGRHVLLWAAIFQVFDAMCITFMNALRGAGDTRWPAIMVGLCCWVIFIGGGYALSRAAPGLGLNGPWLMCTVYIVLLGVILWMRWLGGRWRRFQLFDQAPPPDVALKEDVATAELLGADPVHPAPGGGGGD